MEPGQLSRIADTVVRTSRHEQGRRVPIGRLPPSYANLVRAANGGPTAHWNPLGGHVLTQLFRSVQVDLDAFEEVVRDAASDAPMGPPDRVATVRTALERIAASSPGLMTP